MNFLLGNLAIGLGHVPHHLKCRTDKGFAGTLRIETAQVDGTGAPESLVELVPQENPDHKAEGPAEYQANKGADQFADKCIRHQRRPCSGSPHIDHI